MTGDGSYPSAEASISQLDHLLLFFSPRSDHQDIRRLNWYGHKLVSTAQNIRCDGQNWNHAYARLARACLQALQVKDREVRQATAQETLNVLTFATTRAADQTIAESLHYFQVLAEVSDLDEDLLARAILAPLHSTQAYTGLAKFLTRPASVHLLSLLGPDIDDKALASSLKDLQISSFDSRQRLWLFGNVMCLCGFPSNAAMGDIANLLGSLASEVDFDRPGRDVGNIEWDRELSKGGKPMQLNQFLVEQFSILTMRDPIRSLLVKGSTADARAPANLALTLLRCFPRKADDIRMWLYHGTTAQPDMPPTQYFWHAMEQTAVFKQISADSRVVVRLLSPDSTAQHKDDWTVIMLFLELYTFLIKFVDDEAFLGRGAKSQGTIAVEHVGHLVTFLKNLGFSLCYSRSELNEVAVGSALKNDDTNTRAYNIAGIPGVDLDYLKGIVTGLLRAIYERDSRRRFLSTDHWLMTSRFDMTAFIPAVVQEEVNRRHLSELDPEDAQSDDTLDQDNAFPVVRHARSSSYAAMEARQKRASRQRYLEMVTPRLEILQNMPFFIPFDTRVEIFRQFILLDQRDRRDGHVDQESWRTNMMFNPNDPERRALASRHANIRRKTEFHDAYEQFYSIGENLKEPIQITFWDEHGLQEAGIDGGGVTKEFLTTVIDQAFNGWERGEVPLFFKENDGHLLYPNPTLLDDIREVAKANHTFATDAELRDQIRDIVRQYEFLGRVIGKCLYEGILIDVAFAGFFLKKWALYDKAGGNGYRASINDLRDLDEDLYRGLLDVKNAPDASVYDLNFTVDDIFGDEGHRVVRTRPLIPNGANIPVTNENKLRYITQMSWWRLQGQSAEQTKAFLQGLSSIINPSWLSMFNQAELQTLLGGANTGIDVQDLRRNTQYGGTYVIGDDGEEHPSVKLFWSVLQSLPDADRQKVLKFVTSTPRGPLLGFAHLNPKFSIRDSGSDENRFPTTSTCVNLLKLPMYKSEAVLRSKLLYAVNSGAGFDLS